MRFEESDIGGDELRGERTELTCRMTSMYSGRCEGQATHINVGGQLSCFSETRRVERTSLTEGRSKMDPLLTKPN